MVARRLEAAHACAQLAFVQKLDDLAKLPEGDPKRSVLVTNGGCGSGKGYALKKGLDGEFKNRFGAIWDSAGEQCSLDNKWILAECAKRGIQTTLVYVHAEPEIAFERAVTKRFEEEGRVVSKRPFAESYADGADYMRELVASLADNPANLEVVIIHNKTDAAPVATILNKADMGKVDLESLIPRYGSTVEELMARLHVPEHLPQHAKFGLSMMD